MCNILAVLLQIHVWKTLKIRSRSKVTMRDTPSHASGHLCLIWKDMESPSRTVDVTERTRHARWTYLSSYIAKSCMNDLEDTGQGQRSLCATPPHASDHLCLIWIESIQNCRYHRVVTAGRTDGETEGQTDGRTDWNQYSPTTTSLCGGYKKVHLIVHQIGGYLTIVCIQHDWKHVELDFGLYKFLITFQMFTRTWFPTIPINRYISSNFSSRFRYIALHIGIHIFETWHFV